jgi:hypothetical protein
MAPDEALTTRRGPVVWTCTIPDDADTMSWFPAVSTLPRLPEVRGSPITTVCRKMVLPALMMMVSRRWPDVPTAGGT